MRNIILFFARSIFVLSLVIWTSSGIFSLARAHGIEVLRSDPPTGAVLNESPAQVKVWFSEEMQTKLSTLKVLDASGKQVDKGDGGVDLDDPEHASMKVSLPNLPDGEYTVQWHVVLLDDDAADGQFGFTMGRTLPVSNMTPETKQFIPVVSSYTGSSGNNWVLWVLIIVGSVIVLSAFVFFILRRRLNQVK